MTGKTGKKGKKPRSIEENTREPKSKKSSNSQGPSTAVDPKSHRRVQVHVVVPKGALLGVVIGMGGSNEGAIITEVNPDSSLLNKVFCDDWMTAIDGEDITDKTLDEVTGILGRKKNFERRLTIQRKANETTTDIDSD